MAKPWDELHTKIDSDEEYNELITYKGMTCLEVHSGWCGPCAAMVPTLKKLQWDMVEERGSALQFVVAKSDSIEALKEYCDRSKPAFLFFRKGAKVMTIDGANANAVKAFIEENTPTVADVKAEG